MMDDERLLRKMLQGLAKTRRYTDTFEMVLSFGCGLTVDESLALCERFGLDPRDGSSLDASSNTRGEA